MSGRRVLVLGGTQFIGRRIVEQLHARGDRVLVAHRGRSEPDGLPAVGHLHVPRADLATVRADIEEFGPTAVVDTMALSAAGADAVLAVLPDVPIVVLSSADVYQAYDVFRFGTAAAEEIGVPLTESSPVRTERYPYRDDNNPDSDYEKLDVEPRYLDRGAVVLRLGFVYGERDPQRREEFVLRRVRAGRTRIPFGCGSLVLSRLYVDDAAATTLAALDTPAAAGEIFNVVESASVSVGGWARQILAAAGSASDLVRVPGPALPGDLELTDLTTQHMLISSAKAQRVLGWTPTDPAETVARSVRWHLANPPTGDDPGFEADDAALAAAT